MAVSAKTRKAQLGREGTKGSAVAATALWRGMATMEDLTTLERVEEDVGVYGGYGRLEKVSIGAQIDLPGQPATYQQLPHIFEAGIKSIGTGSGTGATWTFAYTVSTSSANTIKTYTWEVGDGIEAEEAEYCFVESFELSGAVNEMLQVSATWRGRQVIADAFTGSISAVAANAVVFNTGTLFIDDAGATLGDTQVSNSFRSFSLSVETGYKAIWTGEGSLYFTYEKLTDPVITLEITAEHDATWKGSGGEKAAWRAKTGRLVRVTFSGTGSERLQIDLAGKWETFGSLEEDEGNSVLRGSMFAYFNTTDNLFCEIEVRKAAKTIT